MTDKQYLIIKLDSEILIGEHHTGEYQDSELKLSHIMGINSEEVEGHIYYFMSPWFILAEDMPFVFNKEKITYELSPSGPLVDMYLKTLDKYLVNYRDNSKDIDLPTDTKGIIKIDKTKMN